MADVNFKESYEKAEKYNIALDNYFSNRFTVIACETRATQSLGVDRFLVSNKTGLRLSVEYKVDFRAGRSGNAFIETRQRFEDGRLVPGWGFSTCAQLIAYFVVGRAAVYLLDTLKMKRELPHYSKFFPKTDWVVNLKQDGTNYAAKGILVPLEILEKACLSVENLEC
jgi:hypothetical protein